MNYLEEILNIVNKIIIRQTEIETSSNSGNPLSPLNTNRPPPPPPPPLNFKQPIKNESSTSSEQPFPKPKLSSVSENLLTDIQKGINLKPAFSDEKKKIDEKHSKFDQKQKDLIHLIGADEEELNKMETKIKLLATPDQLNIEFNQQWPKVPSGIGKDNKQYQDDLKQKNIKQEEYTNLLKKIKEKENELIEKKEEIEKYKQKNERIKKIYEEIKELNKNTTENDSKIKEKYMEITDLLDMTLSSGINTVFLLNKKCSDQKLCKQDPDCNTGIYIKLCNDAIKESKQEKNDDEVTDEEWQDGGTKLYYNKYQKYKTKYLLINNK